MGALKRQILIFYLIINRGRILAPSLIRLRVIRRCCLVGDFLRVTNVDRLAAFQPIQRRNKVRNDDKKHIDKSTSMKNPRVILFLVVTMITFVGYFAPTANRCSFHRHMRRKMVAGVPATTVLRRRSQPKVPRVIPIRSTEIPKLCIQVFLLCRRLSTGC